MRITINYYKRFHNKKIIIYLFILFVVFIISGITIKYIRNRNEYIRTKENISYNRNTKENRSNFVHSGNKLLLIPSYYLFVNDESIERNWSNAFADVIGGKTEVVVDYGRADIITDKYAIEVDYLTKWKEGIGQALQYGSSTKLTPVLALIMNTSPQNGQLEQIDSLCTSKGVKIVLLYNENIHLNE